MTPRLSIPDFVTRDGPRALCAEVGGDWWFPEPGASMTDIARAKDVCDRCELRQACLAYATEATDGHGVLIPGIWGGTTVRERRAMRMAGAA